MLVEKFIFLLVSHHINLFTVNFTYFKATVFDSFSKNVK